MEVEEEEVAVLSLSYPSSWGRTFTQPHFMTEMTPSASRSRSGDVSGWKHGAPLEYGHVQGWPVAGQF